MRRILVTGATGFIGSHVTGLLAETGVTLRALVRPATRADPVEGAGIEIVRGVLEDAAAVERAVADVDAVVHLAARTHARSEAEYLRANAAGTGLLVNAALAARPRPRRLVFLSSLSAVGPSRGGRPVGPEDTPRPLTAYGRSKLAAETACLDARDALEVVVLRAPAVYGPRDREMLRLFRFARAGWVPVPGGGPRPIQLVHVTDLARAVVLAATLPGAAGVLHIAEPRSWDMLEVARLVVEAVGTPARVLPLPGLLVRGAMALGELANRARGRSTLLNRDKARELLAPGWLCETEAARRALGFEASIPLPAGLRATAEWYRDNGWLRA